MGSYIVLSFKNRTHRKYLSAKLIHSNVCGSMSQESIGGSKYFVSFKDDCSAFRIIYFIKHKSEVLKKLEEFVNLVENKFQKSIKILRVDNSKE